jgi:hypothetical protein
MFDRVDYPTLNSRQQEAYDFQKVSAVLADYGFTTHSLPQPQEHSLAILRELSQ